MSVEEIVNERKKFQDEENKIKLRETLKIFSNSGDDETIKMPFDNAMFLLKHYNRRTVISEDGQVVHHNLKDPDFYKDETNFYIPIDEAEKKPDEEKIQEIMLPEGNLTTMIKRDGIIYINEGTDKEITAKNNQILTNKILETEAEKRVQKKQHKQEELSIEEAKELIENSTEKLNDGNVVTLDATPIEISNDSSKKTQTDNKNSTEQTQEIKNQNTEEKNKNQSATSENNSSQTTKEKKQSTQENSQPISEVNQEESSQPSEQNPEQKNHLELVAKKAAEQVIEKMFETTKLKEENEKFKEENEKIKVDNERLLDKSIKCDLTRLYNKNKFMEDEKSHCELYTSTMAFIDGDKVLMKLGDTLFSNIRDANVKADIYRYGGEEIIIWFHDADPLEVFTVLEDIRTEMEDFYFEFEPMEGKTGPKSFHMTVSIGVAFQLINESLLDLRKRADGEVYNAKTLGRNRISISEINKAEKKVFSKFRDENFMVA